jgi:glycosyltransferase involved in cell wall biosynthesis
MGSREDDRADRLVLVQLCPFITERLAHALAIDFPRNLTLSATRMKLLIAIPALNEEESIEAIIERSLEARADIIARSPITQVDVTVVSDGSTDRTVSLARKYTDTIKLIVFEQNRGYGAAIQQAWLESDADLLGFLDADGTCEPRFFGDLARALAAQGADVALGCRLNQDSEMPLIRRTGNILFAGLLTVLSGRSIRDTASGMRVVRREAYARMRPLPAGLHFTPAMSARALLDRDAQVKLIEIDMPYHERIGDSKLKVGKDGLRFLKVITKTAVQYRPVRVATILGVTLAVTGGIALALARRRSWRN